MDDDWKDWGVVEDVCKIKVPGFMTYPGPFIERSKELYRDQWADFVELLSNGTGYERLLTLRENMKARKEKFARDVEKWEDREDWLGVLEGAYANRLQRLAGIESPSAIWRTHGVNDPVDQLPDAVTPLADQPIVETLVDFQEDGRLTEWPDLDKGWNLSTGTHLQSPNDDSGEVLQRFDREPEDVDAHQDNTTIYRCVTEGELRANNIDPDHLPSPQVPFRMEPSTTWREAFLQIEEEEQSVREKKEKPKRTLRVLDFRLRILENVLHRFETFGSVEPLTEQEATEKAHQEPSYITDPPDDLFEGSGTKDRKRAKHHARELSELYDDPEEEVPEDDWSELHGMMDGDTRGRSKIVSIRSAFQDHPETEDPGTSERLAKACYFFFNSSLR